jgi:hypothetical protein
MLVERNKWKNIQPKETTGDLILLNEDNLPPLVWKKKAVVSDIHAGRDGLIRVVTRRTAKGTLTLSLR